jgi:hypothetical protein
LHRSRWYPFALVLIALVAAYLRLDRLDLTEFRREEANALLLAADFLATGHPPLTSISTSLEGLENGPIEVYLAALPLLVARDASLVAALIALLNVGAVLVAARLAERAYGRAAALCTAATYAVGAWAVYFSRKIWPNDPMPLFTALLALSLFDAVVGGRRRGLALAGLWLGALLNLHPSSYSLLPLVALALLTRPALLKSREALVGAGAVVLVSAPFLYHQVRDGYPAAHALRAVAAQPSVVDAAAFGYAGQIVGPGAYRFLATGAEDLFGAALPEGGLAVVMAGLLWLGAATGALLAWRAWRRGCEWRAPALPVACALVPVLVASRHQIDLWVHYFIFLTPILFVLVGLALAAPLRLAARSRVIWAAPLGLVLWAGVVQVQQHLLFWDVLERGAMRTVYGTPWAVQRQAADRALALADGGGVDLLSQRPEHSGADDYLPVWRFLIPERVPLRFDDGGGWLRLTGRASTYVLSPTADPRAAEVLLAHGATPSTPLLLAGLPQPGFAAGYQFLRASASPPTGAALGRLEGGIRLERVLPLAEGEDAPRRGLPEGRGRASARAVLRPVRHGRLARRRPPAAGRASLLHPARRRQAPPARRRRPGRRPGRRSRSGRPARHLGRASDPRVAGTGPVLADPRRASPGPVAPPRRARPGRAPDRRLRPGRTAEDSPTTRTRASDADRALPGRRRARGRDDPTAARWRRRGCPAHLARDRSTCRRLDRLRPPGRRGRPVGRPGRSSTGQRRLPDRRLGRRRGRPRPAPAYRACRGPLPCRSRALRPDHRRPPRPRRRLGRHGRPRIRRRGPVTRRSG